MAFYVFRCPTCGTEFEHKSPMSEIGDTATWPWHCGAQPIRVFSPPRIIIMWDTLEYLRRAQRGEEEVPGMSPAEVRQTAKVWERK
jgi:putative FmdB family regulatory protein